MVTSWISRNGSRHGYVRWQTTRPDVELPMTATVPEQAMAGSQAVCGTARFPDCSGNVPRPSLSDVAAALEVEKDNLRNHIEQVSSVKDAMLCIGNVAQILESLIKARVKFNGLFVMQHGLI